MRPAIFGLQKVYTRQGVFVGVNIGYNAYCEHEEGTGDIVRAINNDNSSLLLKYKNEGKSPLYINRQIKKQAKEDHKLLQRTVNSPFAGYVVKSSAFTYNRTINISNKDIENKYQRFLLQDGKYDLFLITYGIHIKDCVEKFKNRKVMNEEEIFYMRDYNNGILGKTQNSQFDFAGAWGPQGVMVLFKHDDNGVNLAEDLADCVKRGYLAIVPEEKRIFKDRGCCLIELDRAYYSR